MNARKTHTIFGVSIEHSSETIPVLLPAEAIYSDDAVEKLPEIAARYCAKRTIAVLMDDRTREVAGRDVARCLSNNGSTVHEFVVPDPAPGASPVCDDRTKQALETRIDAVDLIVTVGSGVVTDLGKWIGSDRGLPFIAFATAASMNGYASANVAPTIHGVKTIHRARPAVAVLSSPRVLRDAPFSMTAAGLGDLLAKSVSAADWYLNHLLFNDPYDQAVVDLIAGIEPLYLDHPADVAERKPAAIEALFQGLILTGVAMTLVGSSTPASGGEHLISHTLDMMSSLDGAPHDLHGRQVGVGTVLASELYRRTLALDRPDLATPSLGAGADSASAKRKNPTGASPSPLSFTASVRSEIDTHFWGLFADVVAEQYTPKIERLRIAGEALSRDGLWKNLRASIAPMLRAPERIRACLSQAGAACRAQDLGMDRERLLTAFLHAHEIRSRFTILDLARLTGVMPAAAGDILQAWG